MATIVPISHSIRWRSRSRNSSMDSVDSQQQQQQPSAPVSPFAGILHYSITGEWDEEPSDDEDAGFDELQSSAWLVVPREYANAAQRSRRSSWAEAAMPVSPLGYATSSAKSLERRRADGSSR